MNYKDKLIQEIEEAKEKLVKTRNNDFKEMEKVKLFLISKIKEHSFDDCDFFEDLEYMKTDPLISLYIIQSIANNKLFKKLGFRDKNAQVYEKDVSVFKQEINRVSLANQGNSLEILIPIRPRDSLYRTIELMKDLKYDKNLIKNVASYILPNERLPRLSETEKKYNKKLQKYHKQNELEIDKYLEYFLNDINIQRIKKST